MVRLRDVQGGMRQAVFLVGVIAGTKHLFFGQDRRNPAGAIARDTQGEDSFHNGSGFLVYDQLLGLQVFDISIGSARPKPLAALRFGLLNCTNLSAGVPNKPLVEQRLFGKGKDKQAEIQYSCGFVAGWLPKS